MHGLVLRIILAIGIFLLSPQAAMASDFQMLPPTDPNNSGNNCAMGGANDNHVLVFNGNPAAGQSAINCNVNFTAYLNGSLSIGDRIYTGVDGGSGAGYFWIGPPNLDSGGHAAFGYHYNGSAVDYVDLAGSTVYVENNLGIGTNSANSSLDLSQRTDAISMPSGMSAQRPGSPTPGMTRYNSSTGNLEYFSGTTNSWTPLMDKYIQCAGTSGSTNSYATEMCLNTRNGQFCIAYDGPGGPDSGGKVWVGGYRWNCFMPSSSPSSANNWPWSLTDAPNLSCSFSGADVDSYMILYCTNVVKGATCMAKQGPAGFDAAGNFWSGNFNWDCYNPGALPW